MKNIRAGYYLRYDGRIVDVIDVVENVDTGEMLVLCRINTPKNRYVYAVGRQSFFEAVEVNGVPVPKYRRFSRAYTLTEEAADAIYAAEGAYPPESVVRQKKSSRHRPVASYKAYAKDLCECYLRDVRLAREGAGEQGAEYERAKENVAFLDACLKGQLKEYADYFRERFVEGKSIRKYAAAHGINRGAVDYIQKKFFLALAALLEERAGGKREPFGAGRGPNGREAADEEERSLGVERSGSTADHP